VAPVPAVAAPCDDAASPTMPSRAIEAVECALVLEAPEPPIDLGPGKDAEGREQAGRFELLVALIRDDAPRPLVLAAFARHTTRDQHEWKPVPDATPPSLPGKGTSAMRVVSARVDAGELRVEFTLAPVVAPVAAFHVERLEPPGAGGLGKLEELVDPGASVELDPHDDKRVRVKLVDKPQAGDAYRIRVEGAGASGVLALSDQGLLPLGGGADYTLYVRS
jgi:hypothetical protein